MDLSLNVATMSNLIGFSFAHHGTIEKIILMGLRPSKVSLKVSLRIIASLLMVLFFFIVSYFIHVGKLDDIK